MAMKELVIISGKGGTGKTSLTAAFAALAQNAVLADCDVDAADLHLVLQPEAQNRTAFISGRIAKIRKADCTGCGLCEKVCRFETIQNNEGVFSVDPLSCEGCGVCVEFCPTKAIDFPEQECGEWYSSTTRFGPMVHARMYTGAENSGKLVSLVRQEARKIAKKQNRSLLLVDGPPGIGCPVIASITGADAVLVVTEPTLSGKHDLHRVLQLTHHFNIPAFICINKWDINPGISDGIEDSARAVGAAPLGRISYDKTITKAQISGTNIIEYAPNSTAGNEISSFWVSLISKIEE